jgi:hypothetical protein
MQQLQREIIVTDISARCQLSQLPDAGARLTGFECLATWLYKAGRSVTRKLAKATTHPMLVVRKLRVVVSGRGPIRAVCGSGGAGETTTTDESLHLALQPGVLVRIKSAAAIRQTLDERGRCDGLGYMTAAMGQYCGGTYRVRKRVERFFDERTRRMLKLRNVVVLDGVVCEPAADDDEDYAGCNRTCFLFWKEAWLERIPCNGVPRP